MQNLLVIVKITFQKQIILASVFYKKVINRHNIYFYNIKIFLIKEIKIINYLSYKKNIILN